MNIFSTPPGATIAGPITVATVPGSPLEVIDKRSDKTLARLNYGTTPVTTAAFIQLIAATPVALTGLEIFDSSGQTLKLYSGAPGSEVELFQIVPGGNNIIPEQLPINTRLSLKAVSANATSGEITVNYLA